METDLQNAVKKLEPGTTAGKVRAIMPEIERQIDSGVTWAEIVQALNDAGLKLTYNNFQSILYRYRKKHGRKATRPATPVPESSSAPFQAEPEPGTAHSGDQPNLPDRDAFERSLNPETRYKTADRLMQASRRFGHHTKRKDEK